MGGGLGLLGSVVVDWWRGVVSYFWYVDCQCSVVAVFWVGCCGGDKLVV